MTTHGKSVRGAAGSAADEAYKHHYIPKFYQKQWAGADNKLSVYARRENSEIMVRRKSPKQSGYEPYLYSVPGLPPEQAHTVETKFMREMDSLACRAMHYMIGKIEKPMDIELRSAWSRFLLSLLLRHPASISRLKAKMLAVTADVVKDFVDHYGEEERARLQVQVGIALTLQSMIDNTGVGMYLNRMDWRVTEVVRADYTLLTSDRPVVLSNGLLGPDGHMALSISPRHVFIAANNADLHKKVRGLSGKQIVRAFNEVTVEQADRWVFGADDRQLQFVRNRMSTNPQRDLLPV